MKNLRYLILIFFLPFLPLIAFFAFVKGILLMLFAEDRVYTFNPFDGLLLWSGRRVSGDRIFALVCVAGVVWMSSLFFLAQLEAYLEDRAFEAAFHVDEVVEGVHAFERAAKSRLQEEFETTRFVRDQAISEEHRKVVRAIAERLPASLGPEVLTHQHDTIVAHRGEAIGIIAVRPPGGEIVMYWRVEQCPGLTTVRRLMAKDALGAYPRPGFSLFRVSYGRYVLHGVAPVDLLDDLQEAFGDADAFTAHAGR